MEKSKNKKANNLFWYVIGLCVILITLTSVFMSVNRKKGTVLSTSEADTAVSEKNDTTRESEQKNTEEAVVTQEIVEPKNPPVQSEEAVTESKETATRVLEYELPVGGYIGSAYSVDVPVYSITMNDYRAHPGIDIICDEGSPVSACEAGVIKEVYNDPMMGTSVVIEHGDGVCTHYMNLSENIPETVTVGAEVKKGELIGAVGTSALVEIAQEPHLHLEVTVSGAYVDPLSIITDADKAVMSDNVIE